MARAQCEAGRTLEAREAQRPAPTFVAQNELHGTRAESARAVVEEKRRSGGGRRRILGGSMET